MPDQVVDPRLEPGLVKADEAIAHPLGCVELTHGPLVVAEILGCLTQREVYTDPLRWLEGRRFQRLAHVSDQPSVLGTEATAAGDVVITTGKPGRLLYRTEEVAAR